MRSHRQRHEFLYGPIYHTAEHRYVKSNVWPLSQSQVFPNSFVMSSSRCPCRIHTYNNPPAPFRFFALPPEIRNMIMTLVVTEATPIVIHRKSFNRHTKPQQRTPSGHVIKRSQEPSAEKRTFGHSRLALLMVSRQAYYDGTTLYYGKNTFSFTLETLRAFCEDIPRRCLSQIRSVHFTIPVMDRHDTLWRMLAKLDALENLEIRMKYPKSAIRRPNWENCIWGSQGILRLKQFRITRYDPELESSGQMSKTSHEMAVDAKDRSTEQAVSRFIRFGTGLPSRGLVDTPI